MWHSVKKKLLPTHLGCRVPVLHTPNDPALYTTRTRGHSNHEAISNSPLMNYCIQDVTLAGCVKASLLPQVDAVVLPLGPVVVSTTQDSPKQRLLIAEHMLQNTIKISKLLFALSTSQQNL